MVYTIAPTEMMMEWGWFVALAKCCAWWEAATYFAMLHGSSVKQPATPFSFPPW